MRETVNVGENRVRNGVTDCPESRNEDKIEKWTKMAWGDHRLAWGGTPDVSKTENWVKKSDFIWKSYLVAFLRRLHQLRRKSSIQSLKSSILKPFDRVDRTRERFCKSGSSFYTQNSVRIGNGSC
ncbi:hypothetical protein E3N88_26012 [Mikania micrantha]|uniref:Uncharacterized protein n=1 Tax=Mikania micrantha TaxID=192012 RepID=A0A5N6N843_9ASTR|nr:hypothetical protein E3N88_26012 [Mikania micrantha]